MSDNIAHALGRISQKLGSRVAVTEAHSGKSCTFSELDMFADRYGAYLKAEGVKSGDRVMLMVRPSIDFIALAFALFRLGAPVILIDPGMGYKNMLRCIAGVKPDHLIGVPEVVGLSLFYAAKFRSLKKRFCCGSFMGIGKFDIRNKRNLPQPPLQTFAPDETSLAAIIFTTGSTGPPKGVRFEHSIFSAQLEKIRTFYGIGQGDVDQPGFPLFALFSTALGVHAVIPDMDPTKPSQVDPQRFVQSILDYQVTYSFGSPAIWQVVSSYCRQNKIRCASLKKVLMAGAPVSGELVERVFDIIAEEGEIHTPYGATECLPIVSIEGRTIVGETWAETKKGKGTCVGSPLPGISLKIIESTDTSLSTIDECSVLDPGSCGEIIVKGDVVTRAYDGNHAQNLVSKVEDGDDFWHRIGDVGYLDTQGRLWFCGRKAHRVFSRNGIMYTICCEALINNHPDVFRSALVGIDSDQEYQKAIIIIELHKQSKRQVEDIVTEVKEICAAHPMLETIEHVLVHDSFPVDIRHNAKIFREKLSVWAQQQVQKQS
ncbi:MAG: AMP-binding protein [Desulfofustis sp.]|nr:AMP-binding protein [Desulfofustis sp.]